MRITRERPAYANWNARSAVSCAIPPCASPNKCATQVRVDAPDLDAILGPPNLEHDIGLHAGLPGVATGLAWTPVGGDILFIEATRISGRGQLILTGQLGGVMKESAQARSRW